MRKKLIVLVLFAVGAPSAVIWAQHERDRHRRINLSEYSTASLSFSLKRAPPGQGPCHLAKLANGRTFPSPTGSYWIRTADDGWCEFTGRKLQSSWAPARRPDAERSLHFVRGVAFLNHIVRAPNKISTDREGECARASVRVHAKDLAPDWGSLTVCTKAEIPGYALRYSVLQTDGGYLPYISFTPRSNQTMQTAIYMLGGPYTRPIENLEKFTLLSHLLSRGDTSIIIPVYTGINRILIENSDNTKIVQRQIISLTERFHTEGSTTCLVGQSLGAFILANVDIHGVDRLLINPLIVDPITAARRIKDFENYTDPSIEIHRISAESWMAGSLDDAKSTHTALSDAFLNYFGRGARVNLVSRLMARNSKVQIIYGSNDRMIGLEALPPVVAAIGEQNVSNVGPVDHYSEAPSNSWAFRNAVDKFLVECSRPRRTVH